VRFEQMKQVLLASAPSPEAADAADAAISDEYALVAGAQGAGEVQAPVYLPALADWLQLAAWGWLAQTAKVRPY
jgi:hypothetical protein